MTYERWHTTTYIGVVCNASGSMRKEFQELSDKFSTIDENNQVQFIKFYEDNRSSIETLTDFQDESEIQLALVIQHTVGRSELYVNSNYEKAYRHLGNSLKLLLQYKSQFNYELEDDIWYLQTLQHLQLATYKLGRLNISLGLTNKLILIDTESKDVHVKSRKKIYCDLLSLYSKYIIYFGLTLILLELVVIRNFLDQYSNRLHHVGLAFSLLGFVGIWVSNKYAPSE